MKRYLAWRIQNETISCIIVMTLLATTLLMSSASASITPSTVSATLLPGESITEHKTVFLPGIIPKGDVVFAFDLTGSMASSIATVKDQAKNIMTTIGTLISDCQFGVISFMDYNDTYNSYGYSAMYGITSDYPYKLDLAITGNTALVNATINGLVRGDGADSPQDYSRIMYESYADPGVGWRAGAKRILLILGDSVPHDDNIKEGVPDMVGAYSTGGDPGRDKEMFTDDDLDLQTTVLPGMVANRVTALYVKCHASAFPNDADNMAYWTYWTGITGGYAYSISDVSLIPTAIQALISAEAGFVHKLTLKVQEVDYGGWLTSVAPPEYDDFTVPLEGVTKTFDITITVPSETAPGTYSFHITADADGADYGEQSVSIIVPVEITPNPSITLIFQPGAEIAKATATETTRYPPLPAGSSSFITSVWDIRVTGTFSGLARVRIAYPNGGPIPTQILQTDIVPGDVNWDGKVDCKDLLIITKALESRPGTPRWNPDCDLNHDNRINLKDLSIALHNFCKSSVWTPLKNIYVNEEGHYIEGDTDHFSIFGGR
jgi:hypothetical protein